MRFLGADAGFGGFEENVGARLRAGSGTNLQRCVRKLRILNHEDVILHCCEFFISERESFGTTRKRMEAEDGAGDDAEGAESAGGELGEIIAGDVLDDFAAAACEGAVGESERDADDKVAERTEAEAEGAAVVGRERATNGGPFGPQTVEGEALAVLREGLLQGLQGAASFHGDGEIGPGVLDDAVEARGRKDDVGTFWRIAPFKFSAAAARDDGEAGFVGEGESGGELLFAFGLHHELGENAANGIFQIGVAKIFAADNRSELLGDGTSGLHGRTKNT